MPFPLDGAAGWHLADHTDGHVEDESRFGIEGLAETHHFGVEFGSHFAGQEVRPSDVGRLTEVDEAVVDELLGGLGTGEEALDGAATVGGVASFGEGRDVLQGGGVLLGRGEDLLAEGAGTRVQTRLAMSLPVGASALARAVEAGAVVTALVGLPGLGDAGHVRAFVVPTADYLLQCAESSVLL